MKPDRTPLPTTIVTGYLGAGKTTLINHLLADTHGRRLMVLVNDFGAIAIDADLIDNKTADTIALTNGCVCCTIGGDLYDAIDRVLETDPRPDALIIETSGVADPGKIAQISIAEMDLHHAGIVSLVDSVNYENLRSDPLLGDTLDRQVVQADLIVQTKADISSPDAAQRVQTLLRGHATAPVLVADKGKVPFQLLLKPTDAPSPPSGGDRKKDHGAVYRTWSCADRVTIDLEDLRILSEPERSGIYRLKGYAVAPDRTIHEVHRAGDFWQSTERAGIAAVTRLVAIGQAERFDPAAFEAKWLRAVESMDG